MQLQGKGRENEAGERRLRSEMRRKKERGKREESSL
jgi:hypothetical protein